MVIRNPFATRARFNLSSSTGNERHPAWAIENNLTSLLIVLCVFHEGVVRIDRRSLRFGRVSDEIIRDDWHICLSYFDLTIGWKGAFARDRRSAPLIKRGLSVTWYALNRSLCRARCWFNCEPWFRRQSVTTVPDSPIQWRQSIIHCHRDGHNFSFSPLLPETHDSLVFPACFP